MRNNEALTAAIDELLSLRDRMVRREIDASNCGTRTDWDRFHTVEKTYNTAYTGLMDLLAAR